MTDNIITAVSLVSNDREVLCDFQTEMGKSKLP